MRDSASITGMTISHYRILSKIGAGGMGEVYLAEDKKLERKVAIKLLTAELTEDAERLRRFIQEAKAASALNHPNIVTIHEIGEAEVGRFTVMEFVLGRTLRALSKPYQIDRLLNMGVQVAKALAATHAAGITHRDIKPENIMVRDDDYVKVLDFGLARLIPAREIDSQATTIGDNTSPGVLLGTIAYMSPEQARGEAVRHATDIFSLGIVLYELATGHHPFKADSLIGILHSITSHSPPPPSRLQPAIPPEFDALILRMLEKTTVVRPTASEVARVLSDLENRATAVAPKTADAKPSPSIAVLPFVNMSADPENEYFCDGLAEELLNALSKIEDLKVAARTSAFSFKGKNVNINEIGQALNVSTVLEGSLRRAGNRLRITVQLIEVSGGYQLWSERYDREMRDIFDVQDEITLAVVDALKIKLLGREKAEALKRGTDNTEAYELYLRARYYWNRRTGDNLKKAIELFQRAISKDPNYALAYVGLADCNATIGTYAGTPASETLPLAKAAAERALKIDNSLAEAHGSLGQVYFRSLQWEQAEKEFQRAISLNPNYTIVRHWYSDYFRALRRFDEALREIKRAQELDPLSPVFGTFVGEAYHNLGDSNAAFREWQRVIELEPNFPLACFFLGHAYAVRHRYEEAMMELQQAVDLSGRGNLFLGGLGYINAVSGRRSEALDVVKELEEKYARGEATGTNLAHAYAGLKDNDQAIAWLEKDFQTANTTLLVFAAYSPIYDQLRNDSRYQDILRRVGVTL